MTDCIHGFAIIECGDCASPAARSSQGTRGGMAGERFALVFAPAYHADSFVHLSVKGDYWKLRDYRSPHEPALVLAQSAPSSKPAVAELHRTERLCEIHFPHSSASQGVGVKDSRYWFDRIEAADAQHAELIAAQHGSGEPERS